MGGLGVSCDIDALALKLDVVLEELAAGGFLLDLDLDFCGLMSSSSIKSASSSDAEAISKSLSTWDFFSFDLFMDGRGLGGDGFEVDTAIFFLGGEFSSSSSLGGIILRLLVVSFLLRKKSVMNKKIKSKWFTLRLSWCPLGMIKQ